MKKFVSIVLALALALSLCTVAFATTTKTESLGRATGSVEGFYVRPYDDNENLVKYTVKSHGAAGWDKYTVDDETVTKWYAEFYTDENNVTYYVCDESLAKENPNGYRVFDKNGFVCYAFTGVDYLATIALEEGTYVKKGAKDECEAYKENTIEFTTVTKTASSYDFADFQQDAASKWTKVVDGSSKLLYVDGKVMATTGSYSGVYLHKFDIDKVTFGGTDNDNHKVLTKVYCDNCKKTFDVVTKLGAYEGDYIKLTVDNSDVATVYYTKFFFEQGKKVEIVTEIPAVAVDAILADSAADWTGIADDVYFILLEGTAASTSTDKAASTVDSSKTFDAGVAVYAALSLASVAGSAVVIGKKKEF